MSGFTDAIDLPRLGLRSGAGRRADLTVRVAPFVFAGEPYSVGDGSVELRLDVSRTPTGYAMRLRLETRIVGPCMRCFDRITLPVRVDGREVHDPSLGPDSASDYVDAAGELDLADWARDAISLSLPAAISAPLDDDDRCTLCRRTAAEIGLADAQEAAASGPDPRWAKLRDVEL